MSLISVIRRSLSSVVIATLLCLPFTVPVHAQEYNCGAYGANSYNGEDCGDSASATTDDDNNDDLSNTGENAWIYPVIASALIVLGTGIIILTYRNSRKRRQSLVK